MSQSTETFSSEVPVSLSRLVELASAGSTQAENQLAKFLFAKAMQATREKLLGRLSIEDREDLAISAVKSFCLGIRGGEICYQGDGQLYSLLHKIIDAKIRKLWQYQLAGKRDIRRVESVDLESVVQASTYEPTLVDSVQVTDEEQPAVARIMEALQTELKGIFAQLLSDLDEHPRRLLLAMLESDSTNEELSKTIGRSVASIERYRKLIRHKLESLSSAP